MIGYELLGWAAAGLMLLTFWCIDARAIRGCAIAASLTFIAYGLAADLAPVVALHLVLLPVNLFRLMHLHSNSPSSPTLRCRVSAAARPWFRLRSRRRLAGTLPRRPHITRRS